MEYTIISTFDPERLREKVNKLISDGWIPQGGVSVASNGRLAQALVKVDSSVLDELISGQTYTAMNEKSLD